MADTLTIRPGSEGYTILFPENGRVIDLSVAHPVDHTAGQKKWLHTVGGKAIDGEAGKTPDARVKDSHVGRFRTSCRQGLYPLGKICWSLVGCTLYVRPYSTHSAGLLGFCLDRIGVRPCILPVLAPLAKLRLLPLCLLADADDVFPVLLVMGGACQEEGGEEGSEDVCVGGVDGDAASG